jgi:hypothetical protein
LAAAGGPLFAAMVRRRRRPGSFNACWAITSGMHLVAEVWPATFVEEGSITRNIPI